MPKLEDYVGSQKEWIARDQRYELKELAFEGDAHWGEPWRSAAGTPSTWEDLAPLKEKSDKCLSLHRATGG